MKISNEIGLTIETHIIKPKKNINSGKAKTNFSDEIKSTQSSIYQKKQLRASHIKIILNTLMSIILLFVCVYAPFTYSKTWQIFYYMTLWSFYFNSFYIISITIVDWLYLIKHYICEKYNSFLRDRYIRICFPFALAIVILYWILILLGNKYEYSSWDDIYDPCFGFIFHGLIFFFLLFDICTAFHVNKQTYLMDLIIITAISAIYFFILGLGKYLKFYQPYDFMSISSVRQIIGSAILIYIAILDAYVVLCLIANRLFEQEYKEKNYGSEANLKDSSSFDHSQRLLENNISKSSHTPLKTGIEKEKNNPGLNDIDKYISKSSGKIQVCKKNII